MAIAVALRPSGASSPASVTARPFQHTASAVVGTRTATRAGTGAWSSTATSANPTAVATATIFSGPTRLRTRSDHTPTASLPAPPNTCAMPNTTAAAVTVMP